MPDRGVYYIAVNEAAVEPLGRAVESLARSNPGIRVTVATDYPEQARGRLGGMVERVIPVPRSILPGKPQYPDHGFFSKVKHFYLSPYDFTLFLDFDTHVIGRVDDVFRVLEDGHFHMAMAHDTGRSGNCKYISTIPMAFRTFNTGVVAYQRCAVVEKVMGDWWANMRELDDAWGDQPAFMKAVYDNPALRYATLPCEYNLRFIFPQAPYNEVVVLHGREGNGYTLEQVAARVNKTSDTNRFWFKNRCYGYYDMATGELK